MTLTYDGHDLETIGFCGNPEIVHFDSQADYAQDVTERGVMLLSRRWGAAKVSFDIGIVGTASERRMKLSTLASWLNVTEPKNLVLPDMPTWFYKAVPDGQITTERGINGEIANVSFTLTDPVAYGEYKSVSFSSDSPASFTVGGNYPTMPNISIKATTDSTNHMFMLNYTFTGASMTVYSPNGMTDRWLYFFCNDRLVSYTSSGEGNVPLTLDSTWFRFEPSHGETRTVRVYYGTSTNGTLSWYERWL